MLDLGGSALAEALARWHGIVSGSGGVGPSATGGRKGPSRQCGFMIFFWGGKSENYENWGGFLGEVRKLGWVFGGKSEN